MRLFLRLGVFLLLLFVGYLLTGCGGGGGTDGSGDATADSTAYPPGILFASAEGGFRTVWPSGCDRVRTRVEHARPDTTQIISTHLFCDRAEREHEGFAVSSHYQLQGPDGGPATPQNVIEIIQESMARLGVRIQRQRQIQKGPLTGIELQCQEPEGDGTVWFEGFLQGNTGYVISAWKLTGSVFEDYEVRRFFASFELLE
ncbi:MAG: hypothetical protein ABIF77_07110 [bacterium]